MSSDQPNDAELVKRCLAADEQAWAILVERYADYVHALAIRGFHFPPEDAEEVFQETMMQIYEHLGNYRGTGPLRAWIGAIAQNVARQRLRGRSRHPESALPDEAADVAQQRALEAVEEALLARTALAQVEAPCREILNRFFSLNQKYAEIARVMGIPEGTVASRIARCLMRLRQILSRTAQSGKK